MIRPLRSPFTFLALSIVALITYDHYVVTDHFAFLKNNPNPFMILSVFLSAFYGLRVAIVSSLVCSLTYLLMVHLNVNYQEVETIFSIDYLYTPLLLTIISVVIGELKQRSLDRIKVLQTELSDLSKHEEHYQAKTAVQEKEITELKKRLVSKLDTARSFHDIATSFQSLDEETLFTNLGHAIKRLLGTDDVHIYQVDASARELLQWHGHEVISFDHLDWITAESLRSKSQITLSDVFSLKQFQQETRSVLLALPLVINGNVEYIVRVSNIPFLEYIPSHFKITQLYAEWVCSSLQYSRNYRSSLKNSIWNDQLQIYKHIYFADHIEEEFSRSKTFMLPLTVMRIKVDGLAEASPSKNQTIKKVVCGLLSRKIRKLDYITEGKNEDEFLVIQPICQGEITENCWLAIDEEFRKLDLKVNDKPMSLRSTIREFTPQMQTVQAFAGEFI